MNQTTQGVLGVGQRGVFVYIYIYIYIYLLLIYLFPQSSDYRRLPDGVGTIWVFTEGHKSHNLQYFVLTAHMLPHVVMFYNMLPHFAHIFPRKFIRGNCGTSATTPFVPTRSREAVKTRPMSRRSQDARARAPKPPLAYSPSSTEGVIA